MVDYTDFKAYFNRDFWKSFDRLPFSIRIPNKEKFVRSVYLSIKNKTYYPSIPIRHIDLNKGNGVTRTIPVFDIKDYCVYYFCIKILENKIAVNRTENTFGGWTLGGAIRKFEDQEMILQKNDGMEFEDLEEVVDGSVTYYSFNPHAWAKVYGDFNSKLYVTAKSFKDKTVAELDIANFYDSVRLDVLENKIRQITTSNESEIVSLLFHLLNYWNRRANFYNKQTVGLPQDALGDCSRILANFYLQDYDAYIQEKAKSLGGIYFRYADDQFLFARTRTDAEKLVSLASKKLNTFGLSVNQKKVNYRTAKELIQYRQFAIFDILKKDSSPSAVEKFVDKYLSLRKRGIKQTKDQGLPLLSKLLYCNLEFLPKSKKKQLLRDFLREDYIAQIKSDKMEKICHLLPARERKKFIKKLLKLSLKLQHNSYHLELIKFLKVKRMNVTDLKGRVRELEREYDN